ncbi:serine hydrolase [Deinococcus radiomollis]|uniref:serine hydrolase n=1 Tax=Deinococcus radiomollis TaxID=468916 RepID=UPI003892B26D
MNSAIRQTIATMEHIVGGTLAYFMYDVKTRQVTGHRTDEPRAAASTYKLPVLIHCALLVEEGKLSWNKSFQLQEKLKSRGTGILKDLSVGMVLTLRDVCYLMIALSDNTATDILIDCLGIESVNRRLNDLGCSVTRLERQIFPPNLERRPPLAAGMTTPGEMGGLLLDLVQGKLAGAEATQTMLWMLSAQQDRSMIPRYLPAGWLYAGKTGSNSDLRADVGLVTSPVGDQVVLAMFCEHSQTADWSVESPGTLALARLARHLLVGEGGESSSFCRSG